MKLITLTLILYVALILLTPALCFYLAKYRGWRLRYAIPLGLFLLLVIQAIPVCLAYMVAAVDVHIKMIEEQRFCWRIGTGLNDEYSVDSPPPAPSLLGEDGYVQYLKRIKGVTGVREITRYDLCILYRVLTEKADFLVAAGPDLMVRLEERSAEIMSGHVPPYQVTSRVLVTTIEPRGEPEWEPAFPRYTYGSVINVGEGEMEYYITVDHCPLPPVPGCVLIVPEERNRPEMLLYPPLARKIFREVHPEIWTDLEERNFAVEVQPVYRSLPRRG